MNDFFSVYKGNPKGARHKSMFTTNIGVCQKWWDNAKEKFKLFSVYKGIDNKRWRKPE